MSPTEQRYIPGDVLRLVDLSTLEVQPREVQGQLWEELEETLKPMLGDDYMLSIATALRQEGMQQGILQGMQRGVEKVAKSLLSKGMTVDFVADSTGMALDLVVKWQEETRH